jgi:hypothetical protein
MLRRLSTAITVARRRPAGRRSIRSEREPAGAGSYRVLLKRGIKRVPANRSFYRQHRWSRRTDQGRPPICPAVSSEWRSEWRPALKRRRLKTVVPEAAARFHNAIPASTTTTARVRLAYDSATECSG